MIDNRLGILVKRLSEKTERGELRWEEGVKEGEYQTNFPTYSVRVYPARDEDGDEGIWMTIIDGRGRRLETVTEFDFRQQTGDMSISSKLSELYEMGRRQALGVDKAIDELLQQVG